MSHNSKIKVGIIGLGMVGEPIRKWFEELNGYKRGQDLFCYDVDQKKGYVDDVTQTLLTVMNVLDILVYFIKQTYLDHIVDDYSLINKIL